MSKLLDVSNRTLERLPLYCNLLRGIAKTNQRYISSTAIAEEMNLTPIQVRKDISQTGISGKPKVGYKVETLLKHLIRFLGWNKVHQAIIIGCGNLGKSLIKYDEFSRYGFDIVAGFDTNENIIGKKINNKSIYDVEQLDKFLAKRDIKIAIIAVDESAAQTIADRLVKNNIKAIWNFAPISLDLPEEIVVQQQDMSPCIAFLTKKIKNQKECIKNNKEVK